LFFFTFPYITTKKDIFLYFAELTVISGIVQSACLIVYGLNLGEIRDFLLTTISRSKSLPSVLHLFAVGGSFLGSNSSGREADLSSSYILVEVKNEWSCTSFVPYVFLAPCVIKYRYNFIFYINIFLTHFSLADNSLASLVGLCVTE
jgi:hypothetical protein